MHNMSAKPAASKRPSKKSKTARSWEHPERSGIKITEIANQTDGVTYGTSYRVIVPSSVTKRTGKRLIKYFKAKADALKYAEDQLLGHQKHGQSFSSLTAQAQKEAMVAWAMLSEHGVGFIEAAEAAIRVLCPEGGKRTVADVLGELRTSKKLRLDRGELRQKSWDDYKTRSSKIETAFGTRIVSTITTSDLTKWLHSCGKEGLGDGPLGSRSVKNYRNALSELFIYASKKRYCVDNPLARLTREDVSALGGAKSKRAKINVLSVAEAEQLIHTAAENPKLDLLPSVTLRLFCGLRTEEICRLTWHDVRWQEAEPYVHISEDKAKGRSARNVTIPANALEWLALCPVKDGPLARGKSQPGKPAQHMKSPQYCKKFRRLVKLAGLGEADEKTGDWCSTWETNDTRHSFGSYHFAKGGDSIRTSNEMGHRQGDAVLFNHYRRLATKAEGERFFSIKPGKKLGELTSFPKTATA
jgi:integrase